MLSCMSAVVQCNVQSSLGNANAAYCCCFQGESTQLYIMSQVTGLSNQFASGVDFVYL